MAWIIPVVFLVVLFLPAVIAERYTSPTQDGQYIRNPLKAYRFVITLAGVGDSAALGSSGKALSEAKILFLETPYRPVKVELLFFSSNDPYIYLRRSGEALFMPTPPKLVWEIWGRSREGSSAREPVDVIGYLDYDTAQLLSSAPTAEPAEP